MTAVDLMVVAGGVAAIAWVNWYFLLSGRASATAVAAGGRQEQVITVRGGYDPAVVHARAGQPLRLVFDRQEDAGCSEEVVLPSFGKRTFLAPFAKTPVDLPATVPGRHEFTCGMGMLRGTIVVE